MPTSNLPVTIEVIDSHTAGEPTRCVLSGGPNLGSGPMSVRLARFRREHDAYRRAILCEPRGSDVLVGALLLEPLDVSATAGVIFFNNAGYLGMCGHGMMGVVATLAYMGRISAGQHLFETPVGNVRAMLTSSGEITVDNVESYRYRAQVTVQVPEHGTVHGDVAWGGNWFFLIENQPFHVALENVGELTEFTWQVRQALWTHGITGADGAEIDHIELFTKPVNPSNDSRNFVLCPGKAYDRSPCGTGTSAKMACLVDSGKLFPGQSWRQEGILGTVFTGTILRDGDRNMPQITGSAYVTAETKLVFQPGDPFRLGVPPALGA